MKKYFYSLILIIAFFNGKAQNVPNGGFENWTSHSTFSTPDFWMTTDSISSIQSSPVHSATQEMSIVHGGSSALKLQSWNYTFVTEPGVATNGNLDIGSLSFVGGTADTVRHGTLNGWYRFAPSAGDTAFILVAMTRWNGTSRDTVGAGYWTEYNTVATYTQIGININYLLPGYPDTMLIVISSSSIGIGTGHIGTSFYVDDLSFSGVIGINEVHSNLISAKVYPNPAADFLLVETSWRVREKASVSIFDINGRLIQKAALVDDKQRLDLSALRNGDYFFDLIEEKGTRLHSGKFSISR